MGKTRKIFLILILAIPVLLQSQVKELMFDDYSYNNRVTDLKEDLDGNFVYIGEYFSYNDNRSSAFIVKLSSEGELLKREIFESEDFKRYLFDAIDITDKGTYLVTGSETEEKGSRLIIMEFDKELKMLWKKSYVISEDIMAVFFSILKKVTDGNYILTFYGATKGGILSSRNKIFKLSPTFDSIQLAEISKGYGVFPMTFIPMIDSDKLYLIESNKLYIFKYSDLSFIDEEPLEGSSNIKNIISVDTLQSGKIVYGSSYNDDLGGLERYGYLSIGIFDKDTYKVLKTGSSSKVKLKDKEYRYRAYSSEKNAIDFKDEDNFIVGGSLNVYMSQSEDSYRPYMQRPSSLCVASFDKNLALQWETFYEDGETSYYMMSMCATQDKGAVIAAITCTYEQSLDHVGDIVILKFDPHPDPVKEVIEKEIVKLYPNPACGSVTIDMGDCQEQSIVEVYDISGKLCMSDVILSGGGKKDMDVGKLQSGFYMVKINSGSEPAVTVKLSIKR